MFFRRKLRNNNQPFVYCLRIGSGNSPSVKYKLTPPMLAEGFIDFLQSLEGRFGCYVQLISFSSSLLAKQGFTINKSLSQS